MAELTGTRVLVRFALRKDRVSLPLWVVALGLVPAMVASAFDELYVTQAALRSAVGAIAANPSLTALFGPVFDVSVGGLTAWRIGSFGATFAGLFSVFTVLRHTRVEEESGRADLLRSAVVGRDALLASGVVVAVLGNAAIAALAAAGLRAVGQPLPGSVAFGMSFAMTGLVFAGVAAVAAQVTEGARSARGIALAILGASFFARVIANASDPLSGAVWVTPVGWAQQLRPFAGENWNAAAVAVVAAAALCITGWRLSARRDVAAGLVPTRLGLASARPSLATPLVLAWRLQRGSLLAWAVGFASFGLLLGGVTPGLADLVEESSELSAMIERLGGTGFLADSFLAGVMRMYGLVAAAYAISATLRLRTEEEELRAELVLATAASRTRWIASHVLHAFVGAAVLMLVVGTTTGLAYGIGSSNISYQLPRVAGAALAQLPAVWAFAGLAVALFGLLPRRTELSWAALAAAVFITLVGAILRLSQWILDLSPFTHIPNLPGGAVTALPFVALAAGATALLAAGVVGGLRRDIG